MDVRHIYSIERVTDTFVLISDNNTAGLSVTNAAKYIVSELNEIVENGLRSRKIYYRDTTGRYDELKHANGDFKGFAPCSLNQQEFLGRFKHTIPTVKDWGSAVPFG